MSLVETLLEHSEQQKTSTPEAKTAFDYGAIALMGAEDLSNEVPCEEQAISPPITAARPTNKAIKPPIK